MNRASVTVCLSILPLWLLVLISVACAPVRAATPLFTLLHSFSSAASGTTSDGQYPEDNLIQGSDGNFYGTTRAGGAYGDGTVFKITPSGALTTLYSFNYYVTGGYPDAALVQASDGNFYGTTTAGNGNGTVFKITPSGALTTLHVFTGADGDTPNNALVAGSDGSLYGTTLYGGSAGNGTVFKITLSGTLTTLHMFSATAPSAPNANSDGANPAGLIQGSDGDFYGVTRNGGTGGSGTIYKITASGSLSTLYDFTATAYNGSVYVNSDGAQPTAALVQGKDGDYYGSTDGGGPGGSGTLFKITPQGALATLHSFTYRPEMFPDDNRDGAYPNGLVQGGDGNFYGTTNYAGSGGAGTVFEITPTGTLTTLYSFVGNDGAFPEGGLALGSDGNFYGTSFEGGGNGDGAVFKITPTGIPQPVATLTTGATTPTGATENATATSGNGTPLTYVWSASYGASPGFTGPQYGTVASGGAFSNTLQVDQANQPYTVTLTVSDAYGQRAAAYALVDIVPVPTSIFLSPTYASLVTGGTQSFFANVLNQFGAPIDGAPVTWSIAAGGGSFSSTTSDPTTYTAPAAPGTETIKAVSGGASVTGTITVAFPPPDPMSISPMSGPVGTVVTVTGTNLGGVTAVRFHDANATVFSVNPAGTQVTATVPAGAISGQIRITTPNGSAQTPMAFTVTPSPVPAIASFTPSTAIIGTDVTITGTSFLGVTAVAFNGVPATFTTDSSTQITAIVPQTATTGPISVTSNDGTGVGSGDFTVIPPPNPGSVSPASGPVGTIVTITGTNLGGLSAVRFHDANATVFSVNPAGTQITATVPQGALSGKIRITTPNGSVQTATAFTVTAGPPHPDAFTPASGPVGTVLTITGEFLNGVTAVRFHSANATVFSASADGSTLTVTVPPGAQSGGITVTTPLGTTETSSPFTVTP